MQPGFRSFDHGETRAQQRQFLFACRRLSGNTAVETRTVSKPSHARVNFGQHHDAPELIKAQLKFPVFATRQVRGKQRAAELREHVASQGDAARVRRQGAVGPKPTAVRDETNASLRRGQQTILRKTTQAVRITFKKTLTIDRREGKSVDL